MDPKEYHRNHPKMIQQCFWLYCIQDWL